MLNWNDIIKFASKGNPEAPRKVVKTDAEWKAVLDPDVYAIARKKGTERAHSSEMCNLFEPGIYACACCETPLFDSSVKFQSGTGWPSFTQPVDVANVAYIKDVSYGMVRVEAICNICEAHLGHVFPDGPAPSGLRYCINALSLEKIKNTI